MHPLLSNKASVNPVLFINQYSTFNIESGSASSFLEPPANEDVSNQASVVEDDRDPFVLSFAHRAKKKRKHMHAMLEAVNNMLDVFQAKWKEDKKADATIR